MIERYGRLAGLGFIACALVVNLFFDHEEISYLYGRKPNNELVYIIADSTPNLANETIIRWTNDAIVECYSVSFNSDINQCYDRYFEGGAGASYVRSIVEVYEPLLNQRIKRFVSITVKDKFRITQHSYSEDKTHQWWLAATISRQVTDEYGATNTRDFYVHVLTKSSVDPKHPEALVLLEVRFVPAVA